MSQPQRRGVRASLPLFMASFALLAASLALLVPRPGAGAPAHPAALAPAVPDRRLGSAVDAFVRPLVAHGDLSGQLLVARGGKIVLERSFGFANAELRSPITPESRMCVASVTKPMTVLVAFRLMEQNKIGYRDSIARWLPDFPEAGRITIEQLLRHRSGIPHEIVPDSLATRARTPAEMVERAKKLPLDFTPGSRSSYSSGGFTVLARILEIASGQEYGALLDEYLFDPMQMIHSRHADAATLMPGRTAAYVPGPRGLENAPLADFSGLAGAGSVWSTARDLHLFVQGVVTGRLGETMRQSFVRGGKLEFSGRTGGFKASADWDSTTGLETILVCNVSTGAPDLLRGVVPRLAAGETVPPPVLPALSGQRLADEELHRFEGDFLLANGTLLAVRAHDGLLWSNDWILFPARDGGFYSPRDYGMVRGVTGPDGRITRLDWTQNGTVYPAPRVTDKP